MLRQISAAAALPLHIDIVKKHLIIEHDDDNDLLTTYIASATQWVEDYINRALVQQSWVNLQNCFGGSIQLNRLPILAVDSIKYIDDSDQQLIVPASDYRVGVESGKVTLKSGKSWPTTLLIEEGVCTTFQAGHLVSVGVDIATDVLSVSGLGFSDDQIIFLYSNHTMPAGLSAGTAYTVINSTGASFQLSLSSGGSVIDVADIGAGDLFIGELSQAITHALLLLIGHWNNNREQVVIGIAPHEIPIGVESLLNPYKAYL